MISYKCDRRLCRAARELLRSHLVDAWQETFTLTADMQFDVDVSEWNVWQLLEATLVAPVVSLVAGDVACPLIPSLDAYKYQEETSILVDGSVSRSIQNAAIPGSLHSGRKGMRKNPAVFYQCGQCRKNFTSRFYLDKHFDNQHVNSILTSNEVICPAVRYCNFLSPTACFDQAMLLEPFYGPGSDGYGSDVYSVQHKLLQMQHVCSEQSQRAASIVCQEIVDVCFTGVFGQILSTNMCSRIESCRSRMLHRLVSSSLMIHPEQWQEALAQSYKGKTVSWTGFLIVISALLLLYGCWFWRNIHNRSVLRRPDRKSLSSNRDVSKWSAAAPATFIGYPSKRKKN